MVGVGYHEIDRGGFRALTAQATADRQLASYASSYSSAAVRRNFDEPD